MTPDTGPATTAAEMLPGRTGAAATKLTKDNEDFIEGKKLKGPVNRKKLQAWLRDKNQSFMASLGTYLDPGQRAVLHDVNRGNDLEALVRLYQRLRTLSTNARLLDENMRACYAKAGPGVQGGQGKEGGRVGASVQASPRYRGRAPVGGE